MKLVPVNCGTYNAPKTVDNVIAAAFNGIRRRPVESKDANGNAIVCCKKTARKRKYAITGILFVRPRAAAPVAPAAAQ